MEDVAKVIELWTGIPAAKVKETEYTKLAHLEENLNRVIIGQPEAVPSGGKRCQTQPRRHLSAPPSGQLYLRRPHGCGQNRACQQLALQLFDTVDPLIRLDMSEFMEKHTVSRLNRFAAGLCGL